jgi:hypothetical protein
MFTPFDFRPTRKRRFQWVRGRFARARRRILQIRTQTAPLAVHRRVDLECVSLPLVFQEMERVLQPGGLLLLAFHIGEEVLHKKELWGRPISMDLPGTLRDFHQTSAEFVVIDPQAAQLPSSHSSFCSQPINRPVRILRCAEDSSHSSTANWFRAERTRCGSSNPLYVLTESTEARPSRLRMSLKRNRSVSSARR